MDFYLRALRVCLLELGTRCGRTRFELRNLYFWCPQRWRKDQAPPEKFRRDVSSAFDMRQTKMSLEHLVSLTVRVWVWSGLFSPLATPTLKELSNALDSVVSWYSWGQIGAGRSRTPYDWPWFPWRWQWALQAWDVGSLASKCQASHMESSRWCPLSDGRI